MKSTSGIHGSVFTRGGQDRGVLAAAGILESHMNKLVRGGIAGFAAWKWGGGLLGGILLFLIIYFLLGYL
jgi:hypothetical protein